MSWGVPNRQNACPANGGGGAWRYCIPLLRALGGIRTHDPLLRRQMLYPAELQGRGEKLDAPVPR